MLQVDLQPDLISSMINIFAAVGSPAPEKSPTEATENESVVFSSPEAGDPSSIPRDLTNVRDGSSDTSSMTLVQASANASNHLLLVSMLEHVCSIYVPDDAKCRKVFQSEAS